jgi:surface antigen
MDTGAKLPDGTPAGHVGYIISKNGDGTITVKDSNWNGDEKISTHNISLTDKSIK